MKLFIFFIKILEMKTNFNVDLLLIQILNEKIFVFLKILLILLFVICPWSTQIHIVEINKKKIHVPFHFFNYT